MKYRLGELIESYSKKCNISNLTRFDVSGISSDKEFFSPTKQVGSDTSCYKIVPPNYFACNLMHVGRDCVLPISLNYTKENKIVSSSYTVFKLKDEKVILKEYFFIFLKSPEKDRYFWFHCDSSVRDGLDFESFCDISLDIPSIDIQRKYVDVYISLLDNLHLYENGLSDLKLVCDGYIEKLRREYPLEEIGGYIDQYNLKNVDGKIEFERGISTRKEMIVPKAKSSDIEGQKVWKKNTFCFATNTARNADSLSIALNLEDDAVVSNTYCTFDVKSKILSSKYLMIYFSRKEFDRYVRFNSWGSVREMFWFEDMSHVSIPIPPISIQNDIVEIYSSIEERKHFIDKLKEEISSICSVLIKGAVDEMRRRNE